MILRVEVLEGAAEGVAVVALSSVGSARSLGTRSGSVSRKTDSGRARRA